MSVYQDKDHREADASALRRVEDMRTLAYPYTAGGELLPYYELDALHRMVSNVVIDDSFGDQKDFAADAKLAALQQLSTAKEKRQRLDHERFESNYDIAKHEITTVLEHIGAGSAMAEVIFNSICEGQIPHIRTTFKH